uniref:LysR family transcriptional regulator n=1 Tax=uncultured bacterium UPO64 TaxID=1776983 RepID=A0A126T0K3_9BACT|nr:hypothetical protein RALTA_A0423 [uncultured bacterium UPO64]
MQTQKVKPVRSALPAGVVALLGSAILAPGMARAVEFEYSGYVREHLSVNLQDNDQFEPKGSPGGNPVTFMGDEFGGQGEFSMIRHSGKLEASADFGPFQIAGVGRIARETRTSYERGLQNASKDMAALVTTGAFGFGALSAPPAAGGFGVTTNANGGPLMPGDAVFANAGLFGYGGGTTDDLLLDDYDSTELRELYVTFSLGDRTHFKLGKQQVVWGETDFFRAMDIIHGYDLRWRSFLELENEELRKPLNLANVTIDVPELAGALQLIYRPGWDGADDVGDDGPLNGGRWAPAPWSGAGVTSSLIGPINRHHKYGDEDDANYGFRWSGTFKQVGYSFAYYRGISSEGVTTYNPILSPGGSNWLWDPKDNGIGPNQRLVELLSPKVETYGFTFNAYSGMIDSVLRGELAFTPNKPYNTGTNTFLDLLGAFQGLGTLPPAGTPTPGGPMPPLKGILNDPNDPGSAYRLGDLVTADGTPVGLALDVPGLGPVIEKDTLKIMLGTDKNLNWTMSTLGTSRPAFWTMQLFDTWVLNYDRDDDIVENFGFGAARREHQTILTNALSFPFKYDTVTPGIALGVDLGSFDSFLIPSLDLQYGDHWRIRFEADLFFPTHVEKTNLGKTDTKTRMLGTLHNRDQFVARITYQF